MTAFGLYGAGVEFFPETDPDYGTIKIKAPVGTNLEGSDEIVRPIEKIAMEYEDIRHVITTVGQEGGNIFESGGSGTLYYVAAALRTAGGYTGTNALFLGDRIAPLELSVDPRDPASFVVTFYTRSAGEPMSAEPTERVSKAFRYEDGVLAELADALEQRP